MLESTVLAMYNIVIMIMFAITLKVIATITTSAIETVANAFHIVTRKEVKITFFFLLTILAPIAIKYMGGSVLASKATGVMLLAVAQHLMLPVHPFLFPPTTTFLTHIRTFIVPVVIITIATVVLRCHGFMPGYPPIGDADLISSFAVVFAVFTVYLVLFGGLIRNGYSRQWANIALLATLHLVAMKPFHPNPLITIVSALVYGVRPVYAVHIAAVAMAVMASKLVERARVALVAHMKKKE